MKLPEISIDWSMFSSSQITIARHTKTGQTALNEPIFSVYSGTANVYDKAASILLTQAGEMESEDVMVVIDSTTSGTFPTIQVGDTITVTNPGDGSSLHRYQVEHVHFWDFEPSSLELTGSLVKAQG
jgi:hypothetical protein